MNRAEDNTDNRTEFLKSIQKMNLEELKMERDKTLGMISHIQQEVSDLAFRNYRTYADIGRMTHHGTSLYMEMGDLMQEIHHHELPQLLSATHDLQSTFIDIDREHVFIESITSQNNKIWQFLRLPKLLDQFIRCGQYEQAYAITNYALQLQQSGSKLSRNPMIKNVIENLLENRCELLNELFSKFAGPIDLAKSLQVINSIRKLPGISTSQLRLMVLQYRSLYLEKTIRDILFTEEDYLLRVIDSYRDVFYDTLVLYTTVFPTQKDGENDSKVLRQQQGFNNSSEIAQDPRWERWTGAAQSNLLNCWIFYSLEGLFGHIKASVQQRNTTDIEVESVLQSLLALSNSLSRFGIDFRQWVVSELEQIVTERFKLKIDAALKRFTERKRLEILDDSIFAEATLDAQHTSSSPIELCTWDDLCAFANELIDAMNGSRHALFVNHINEFFMGLVATFQSVFKWLDGFLIGGQQQQQQSVPLSLVTRATRLLIATFIPHINRLFLDLFSFDHCLKPWLKANDGSLVMINTSHFAEAYNFLSASSANEMFQFCKRSDFFVRILSDIQAKRCDEVE